MPYSWPCRLTLIHLVPLLCLPTHLSFRVLPETSRRTGLAAVRQSFPTVSGSLPWHRREQDIWLMAVASAQGSMLPVLRGPSQGGASPPQQARWSSSDPCRRWNEGRCTLPWCKFRHVCSLCQGAHLAFRCYHYAATSNSTPAATEPQAGKGNSTTKE